VRTNLLQRADAPSALSLALFPLGLWVAARQRRFHVAELIGLGAAAIAIALAVALATPLPFGAAVAFANLVQGSSFLIIAPPEFPGRRAQRALGFLSRCAGYLLVVLWSGLLALLFPHPATFAAAGLAIAMPAVVFTAWGRHARR
jgi:hypothetical protein